MANRKMTFKNLKLAGIASAIMLASADVTALGLGTLNVQSNLDQPLNAVIELRVSASDDIDSVRAAIASRADFESLGIEYPDYLSDITLTVDRLGNDAILRVVSDNVIIKEPFIHFLVRVDWSGGSFLREYTALIDPPIYATEVPKALAEPKTVGTDQSYVDTSVDDIAVEDIEPAEVVDDLVDETFGNQDPVDEAFGNEDLVDEPVVDEALDEALDEAEVQSDEDDFYGDSSDDTILSSSEPTDASYGPVESGESLSQIASELQSQFPDLSIYQIMQVLFEENTSSFIAGNINGLIQGSILNVGDLNAIRAVDVEQSKVFFTTQVEEWDPALLVAGTDDSIKVGQDEYNFGDDDYTDTSSFDTSDTVDTDSFQVGASDDTDTFVSDSSGDSSAGEVVVLRQQITELEASLSSSSLENQELKERISILEGQLSDMESIMKLDVESAELANLEQTLAEQNDAAEEIVADSDFSFDTTDDELLADSGNEEFELATTTDDEFEVAPGSDFDLDLSDSDELIDSASSEISDDLALVEDELTESADEFIDSVDDDVVDSVLDEASDPVEEVEDVVEEIAPVVTAPVQQSQSFIDKITSALFGGGLWKVLAGVGVLLLGGIVALFMRRRRADEEFEISMLSIESNSQSDSLDVSSLSKSMSASVTHSVHRDEGADKETSFLTVYSDSDAVVQADEVDPIAEADVYIAYGRDEQAEEVLLDGVASHPDRLDIKHKLLGLYHKNGNGEGFERVAEELYSQRESLSTDIWQDVCRMGKEVASENPLFDLSADDIAAAEQAADMSDDADVLDDLDDGSADAAAEDDDMALDFSASTADSPDAAPAAPVDDDSIQLINFDDSRSEISELDQVAADALDLGDSAPASADAAADVEFDAGEVSLNDDLDFSGVEVSGDTAGSDASDADIDFSADDDADIGELQEVSGLEIDEDYDEARTQFELAKVFVDLGDDDGARKILTDIIASSDTSAEVLNDSQALLDSMS